MSRLFEASSFAGYGLIIAGVFHCYAGDVGQGATLIATGIGAVFKREGTGGAN